jgi:hypothetical protein
MKETLEALLCQMENVILLERLSSGDKGIQRKSKPMDFTEAGADMFIGEVGGLVFLLMSPRECMSAH